MLNCALVGAGSHSIRNHAPAMRDFAFVHDGAVRLVAVCDLNESRAELAREQFGFQRSFLSIEEMLDSDRIDCAVVVMRPSDMFDALQPFFRRGIPVLTEKPLGDNLDGAREIVESVEKKDAPAMVSFNRRFDPAVAIAREWIRGKGAPRSLRGVMLRHNRAEHDFVWGTGIHLVDLLWYLAGPLYIQSIAEAKGRGCSRVALLSGADDLPVSIDVLPVCGYVQEKVSITGDDWHVELWTGSVHPWRVRCVSNNICEIASSVSDEQSEYVRNGSFAETAAFLKAAIDGNDLPGPGMVESLATAELAWHIQNISHLGR